MVIRNRQRALTVVSALLGAGAFLDAFGIEAEPREVIARTLHVKVSVAEACTSESGVNLP
jgi:hypothetical protein